MRRRLRYKHRHARFARREARTGLGGFLTRLAVIPDARRPRGPRALPAPCVGLLSRAELVLHAGDFVSVAFLEELRAIGPPVEGVSGNMDEPALADSLPKQRVVEVGELRIGMVHDAGPRGGRGGRLGARVGECEAGWSGP